MNLTSFAGLKNALLAVDGTLRRQVLPTPVAGMRCTLKNPPSSGMLMLLLLLFFMLLLLLL